MQRARNHESSLSEVPRNRAVSAHNMCTATRAQLNRAAGPTSSNRARAG